MQQQDLGDNQARFGEIEIWHQAGEKNCQALGADYALRKVEAKIEAFISDMAAALAWADLVVCRAGALTVSELAAAGVGAIFIPFPYAIDDHQTANAQYLVGAEAAEVYQQARLSAQQLAQVLEEKLSKRETLLRMAIRAREKSMPDVARIIADICEEQIYV